MDPLNTTPVFQIPTDWELTSILNEAYAYSPLVREAFWQSYDYSQQIYADQQYLLNQNAALWTFTQLDNSIYSFQEKVIAKIETDLQCVEKLNASLQSHVPGVNDFTWSLATNKMENILKGAKVLLQDVDNFTAILQGHFPEHYNNAPPFPVILGNLATQYGNSQESYLSAAILEVHLALQDNDAQIQNVAPKADIPWIDQAAIAHITPIPKDISLAEDFTTHFSFYFSDEHTPQGFTFIHSGYAFGGQRFESRYPDGKEFGPEDCSSWVAKILQSDFPFSTIDQLFTYRMNLSIENRGYVDPQWLQQEDSQVMELLNPVIVEDPFKDIHPGQVFTLRTFENEDHNDSGGIGGHTTLVLGIRENGNVITIGYARDMPQTEGFGIQEFHWGSTPTQDKMFFEIKTPTLYLEDILIVENSLPGLEAIPPSDPMSTNMAVSVSPNYYFQHTENLLIDHSIHALAPVSF